MRKKSRNGGLLGLGIIGLGLCLGMDGFAREYKVDPSHSNVGFVARHLVSKVNGEFKDFTGNFSFDPKKPEAATVSAVVQVKSITTNEEKRDKHLQSDDFFSAEKYPTMQFNSIKVEEDGDKKYKVEGNLTIRGVTKPVTFEMEFLGEQDDPWGGHRIGFSGSTTINRKDFGMNWNKALDNGGVLIGDKVVINLNVEGLEKKDAAPSAKKLDEVPGKKVDTNKPAHK
jgi:polyisoprenoid-binding protein YceI